MSEDILAEVAAELRPRSVKEGLIVLAAEMREQNRATRAIEKHLATLNGTVAQNALDINTLRTRCEEREAACGVPLDGKARRPDWPQFMPWAITVLGAGMYALGCNVGWW